jgi:hypothetical protein
VAKVYIVKLSQILICTARSTVSGFYFENALKTLIIEHFGYARNGTSCSGTKNLRLLNNIYFYHITIIKWSQICTRTIRKFFFGNILFLAPCTIEIPILTQKFYTHRKK